MTTSQSRLLLIDGHSMAYRAFFALPVDNFSTTTGQSTNAVYGFTSMLINVIRDEQPTHIAVAFDVSRESFRTEQYPEYKDGRTATPEEFKSQIPLIQQVLDGLGVPWIVAPGFEADDILATLAHQADGIETLICSGDRDALQLVTDTVTVLYPVKGVSELARMTPAAVETKYGVPPGRYRDLAALVGEKSDNLPGVPGVGPKTAAKWIVAHDGLDGIVAAADTIKGKAGENFRAHLSDVLRNHQLNRLLTDVELTKSVEDLHWKGWDATVVDELFDVLEFQVLGGRLNSQLPQWRLGAPPPPSGNDIQAGAEFTLIGEDQLAPWLVENTNSERFGIVVDGAFAAGSGTITGVGLASATQECWFDPAHLSATDDTAWRAWLADATVSKAIPDVKPFLWAAAAHGWQLGGLTSDIALAAYLLRPDLRSYALPALASRYLGVELGAAEAQTDQPVLAGFDDLDPDNHRRQAAAQGYAATATRTLADRLDTELRDQAGCELLSGMELPVAALLAAVEVTGIAADTDHLANLQTRFAALSAEAVTAAHAAVDQQFNLRSPKQLQEILFDQLDMPKTKRTKTGYTTDAEALAGLYAKTGHPVLEAILRHRDSERLKQTVDGLLASISDDGRIHTTFHQTVAATGRLSSSDPNLQNIPVRTDAGREIRRGFVVGEGFDTLMTCDYSQIEMRIMAHLSKDAGLIDAFTAGEDLHTTVASRVFGVEAASVDAEQRRRIKAMSYGLAYGLSAYGLSQQLGISASEASELMNEYFERFGGVRDYLHTVVAEARKVGYTETMFGRRRYLPDLSSDNRQRREMAERAALNAPIQGSAADIMKLAMLRVGNGLAATGARSRILLQVHDELVLEIAPGEAADVEKLVRVEMGQAAQLSVPLEVSVGFGRDWDTAAH
ncbi:DNA polymerase I [Stackebrandtia soli]|uniref:DNA polymerase I n=1 Tax=Stackebrandtia soli TaxID=1892856 RepID=UPI0039EAB4B1